MQNSPYPQQQPQQIIVQPTRGRLFSRLGWIGFIICGILLLQFTMQRRDYFDTTGNMQEKYHSGSKSASDKVAIITLAGMIMDGEGFAKRQIDRIREDESVKAIVLRVNSPGGTVTGSDYIYHHLKKLREERDIPMVVSMGAMATSGGYYVSMAVGDEKDSIYAEPTTTTGSIGVIIPHYNVSGLMERFDVKDDSISSHPRKQMLSMTREISEEHREIIQGHIDEMFLRFKQIVKEGRPEFRDGTNDLKYGEIDLATGEIFSAQKAKDYGLIDQVGFIEEAIDRAIELAALDKEKVRVVKYANLGSLFDLPFVTSMGRQRSSGLAPDLQQLFELSAPRAYYLSTSLPPLFRSGE